MKTLLIVLSALTISILPSCKKTYGCECKSTFTIANNGTYTETTVDNYSEKMKEDQAKSACSETETKLKKANSDHAKDIEFLSGNASSASTSCTIK